MPRRSIDFHASKTLPVANCRPQQSDSDRAGSDGNDEPWDDELEEELEPLDDSDLEIDDEPDPDDGDFWIDPDEGEDPWN
jgi:hypothetical protein